MTTWAPQKSDTLRALATEILHNYARGRVLVALDGPDARAVSAFADDLADAVRAEGHAVERAGVPPAGADYDEASFRAEVVDPLREPGDPADVLLLVDGALTGHPELSGLWNYAVWVVADLVADRTAPGRQSATAVIDNTDPEHPRRLFDDAC